VILTVIVLVGLALRMWVVLHLQYVVVGGDGFGYPLSAREVASGMGFLNPLSGEHSALHPPVWTLLLAGAWKVGLDSPFRMQLLAATIGASTVVLVGLAGRRLGGERTGLIAAGVAAVYGGLWIYERALLSETLLATLVTATILLAYAFRDRPTTAKVVGLAVLCAAMGLTRSEQILAVPLLLAPLLLTATSPDTGARVDTGRRIRWLALAGTIIVVCLLPWTIYNLSWIGKLVVLSDGFANTTRVANCDPAYYGAKTGLYDRQCNWGPDGDDAARSYITSHLDRVPVVLVAREGRAWGYWAPFEQTERDATWQNAPLWTHRLTLFQYWTLLPLAVIGAFVLRRRRVPIYPLLTFVAIVAITVAIAFGETRYRAAAEPSIVLLAAVAVDAAARRWLDHRSQATNEVVPTL
jgi:4-amino-4-deoxy-L-arabinose transferase-like glycosyltransferase